MDENEKRNVEDFYAHRKLVLERIQNALKWERKNAKIHSKTVPQNRHSK